MKSKTIQQELNESLTGNKSNLAVEYGSETLTYEELDERTNYIANWLFDKYRKKETFIGVLMDNRMELISTAVGLLKAGCVFIPLDSSYPDSRLAEMIRSTDIECIICDYVNFSRAKAINGSNGGGKRVEFIHIDDMFLEAKPEWFDTGPDVEYDPEDKIYIYFTSGTTGKARAIMGKNKGLRHFIDWEIETFNINGSFRTSQFIIPVFDVFLRDVFVPLCVGGTVCIPESKDIILNPGDLIAWIDKNRIHLINCVPSLFRLMLPPASAGNNFNDLRFVLLAGEKINPPELAGWYDTFGERVQLVNLYGPTETTLAKIHYPIRKSDVRRERIPIGKPMKGARAIILDEKMEICDTLVKGEIYIRTPYRTFGYYNDPGLNRKKFIANPFNNDPEDVLYRTGDLGRLLPDGNIDILGRVDRQVKLRGMRIELEEIEGVLLEHPSVREAVAVKKEIPGNELLAAYIIKNNKSLSGEETWVSQLKAYLSERLPGYMVPARITAMETIPRKPNGKIDYDSLPDQLPDREAGDISPRSEIGKKLAKIWQDILGVDHKSIGVDTRFFEAGGNSLNAMSLMAKIRKEFNIKISLRDVFNNPTINDQEKIIKKQMGEKYVSLEPTEKNEYYELSSQQKRLYFFQDIDEKSTIYNITRAVVLEGRINKEKMERIMDTLTRRHESLRTSFGLKEGEPVQRIHDSVRFTIEYSEKCEDEIEESVKNFTRPFDMAVPPLLRLGLINLGKERHVLVIDMHHIISDGVSNGIFIEEFTAMYGGEELLPIRLHYKDYAGWQNSGTYGEIIKKQEKYWLEIFANRQFVRSLDMPVDYPRQEAIHKYEERTLWLEMDHQLAGDLKRMVIKKEVTLYVLLLAVYNVLLSKYCNQEDIVVGTAAAGRTHEELKNIIGNFINMIPLRNYPRGDKTFSHFLEEVRNNTLNALNNQDYQFEMLISKLNLERDEHRHPLFDTVFQVQNIRIEDRELAGITVQPYPFEIKNIPSRFELVLTAMERGDKLYFEFQYSAILYKRETIETMYRHFVDILKVVLHDDSIKLIDIELDTGGQEVRLAMEKEDTMKVCSKCVLPEVVLGIEFDEEGVCNFCRESAAEQESAPDGEFKNEQGLIACLEKYRNPGRKYDVLVPLSGGVDSCNALITIVEKYRMKPLGFHNDHGYEDEVATRNCKELCRALSVDLVIMQQDFTFMRKLWKYIDEADVKGLNSCYVCGNILYLNALETAHRFNIPLVINGYSKGQAAQINDKDRGTEMLEKIIEVIRKTGDKDFFDEFMDKYRILEKRATFLTRKDLEKEPDLDKILFIPFYIFEFYKIDKEILKNEIRKRCDWQPMKTSYPGRTTNCEMIWLNTYMDLQKMGYSNYNLEYAELVRKGEFTREQALKDLEFNPPPGLVERLAGEIGVDIYKFTSNKEAKVTEEKPVDKKVEIDFDF